MSTTVETNKVTFIGNGVTTAFAFSFRVFAAANLKVYLDGVLKTLTTHYTVTIDPSVEGGTVTFVTAPASSVSVLIKRVLEYTQPSDIPTESNFPEVTIENALDRATMLLVQLKEILSRCPALAITSSFSDLTLPEPSAGKVIGWNDAATDLANLTLVQTTTAYSGTISKGVDASKPASPSQGDIYFATDTNVLYKCITGGSWNAVTERVKGASVASAGTTNIWSTDGDMIHVTGTTTITSLGTALKSGAERVVVFDGALTLTHHATNLILPGGANITTAAGDMMVVRAETTTTFRIISYVKASGLPVVAFIPTAANALSGSVIQYQYASTASVVTCSTNIPYDDSIPQNTEGDEVITVTITPSNSSNILVIKAGFSGTGSGNSSTMTAGAIFQDSAANALSASFSRGSVTQAQEYVLVTHKMAAGTTSPTTFKLRVGGSADTFYVNGNHSGTRVLGGVSVSYIEVWEIKV